MSPEEAFRCCQKLARRHYENFPVGWFIPKESRRHVFALYAFARTADDFADEKFSGDRLKKLEEWEERLKGAAEGQGDHPVFVALRETFRETAIPPQLLADLLTAFRWDVTKKRYATTRELLEYCRYSANPVGRAVLLLFGYDDPELFLLSDKICTGIQLVNHWQDIGIDLEKNRVYLPREEMERFHYTEHDLFYRQVNVPFRELMASQFAATRRLFEEGRPLLSRVSGRLKWQLELMWGGPLKILERIEEAGFDIFRKRPALRKRDLIRLFLGNRLKRG